MSFERFAASHGLMIPKVIADDRVHRVPTEDHPKKRNGAYRFNGADGWCQNWAHHEAPIFYRPDGGNVAPDHERIAELRKARDEERRRHEQAARALAAELLNAAHWAPHPYLESKGFPQECGMVHEGDLIVPMWDFEAYGKRLNSAQRISAAGAKKFLFGGKAKGSVYKIGSGVEHWHCEGLATGLSIAAALKALYRRGTVVVSFSAGNLANVAKAIGGFVVADHDASGTGERVARETGLPWWMPPDVGADANDFHQQHGIRNLAVMLNRLRSA